MEHEMAHERETLKANIGALQSRHDQLSRNICGLRDRLEKERDERKNVELAWEKQLAQYRELYGALPEDMEAAETGMRRTRLKDQLGGLLGITIDSLIKQRHPPRYEISVGGRTIPLKASSQALTHRALQTAVFGDTNQVISQLSSSEWNQALRLISQLVEEVGFEGDMDSGARPSMDERVQGWLDRYLETYEPANSSPEESVNTRKPFINRDGEISICLKDFVHWVKDGYGDGNKHNDIRGSLAHLGWRYHQFSVIREGASAKDSNVQRTTLPYWSIPRPETSAG